MFKWVHISDIHFYDSKRDDVKSMRESLPEKFKSYKEIDALFITGDFRFAKDGAQGDVDATIAYIRELTNSLRITDKQVYCVPGNHDLTRSTVRKAIIPHLRTTEGYTPNKGFFEKDVLQQLLKDFSFFSDIENKLYGENILLNQNSLHKVINTNQCNILLLNTAIAAGNDDDRQNILIGSKHLQDALDTLDKDKPTIMVGHHGQSYFEKEEAQYIQRKLCDKKIAIYLCGHEHKMIDESTWDNIRQYTAGCICECNNDIMAGYYLGTLGDSDLVNIEAYRWISGKNEWWTYPVSCHSLLLPSEGKKKDKVTKNEIDNCTMPTNDLVNKLKKIESKYQDIQQKEYNFILNGHTLIGSRGKEGIKYYWLKNGDRVESITFNTRMYFPHHDPRRRAEDDDISAYTSSVSFGCALAASNLQCRFCETGSRSFRGFLSAEEIALQNIFMALYDADCKSFPEVQTNKREFAFMGQGEPGYCYPAIRRAILLTDIAMDAIGQTVFRYIISTCGISDFMESFINDVKASVYKNRVSLHYSLHEVSNDRKLLMPIERTFNHSEFLELCKKFYHASNTAFDTKEKIGVGIMMFKGFSPILKESEANIPPITLDRKKLLNILSELDKDIFKIDLCDLNHTPSVTASCTELKNEDAQELLKIALNQGFEAKTFSSFGSDKNSGCGMLRSAYIDVSSDGENTTEKYEMALKLLHYAVNELK